MTVRITHNASLKPFNSFAVAANAAKLVELLDETSLEQALQACGPQGPELILGGGSNLLLTRSLDGAVLRIVTQGYRVIERRGSELIVEASAGVAWHEFVLWTLAQGWAGLENLALIPGSVGASPIQNIGAYGVELQQQFAGLSAVHLRSGEHREFTAIDCDFGYRASNFKKPHYQDWLILRVRFSVSANNCLRLTYGEIQSELAKHSSAEPSARDVAEAVIRIRTRKLPSPAVIGNAGSFFKNPILDRDAALQLLSRYPDMPQFPVVATEDTQPSVKISAAWLIERCGWKGVRQGDAGVYAQHALVLVNHGSASGAQLLQLARNIQDSVAQRFGILIEPEPRII